MYAENDPVGITALHYVFKEQISTNKISRTIWEQWLFGPETPLVGHPEALDLDDDLVFDYQNAREFLEKKT